MKYSPTLISLSVISALSVSGCIEVDDDSNRDLVNSLNQQNAILEEQNELITEQNEAGKSVTISGSVLDIASGSPVLSASTKIEVLQGDTLLTTVQTNESGDFTIEGLPSASDLTLFVTSDDDQFMERAFFITTTSASDADVYDDIGYLEVSQAVTVSFSLTDSETGEPLTGLSFRGYSHEGTSSKSYDYAHVSSYDEETGLYTVTLPESIDVTLSAIIDADGDSLRDYEINSAVGVEAYVSGTYLNLASANTMESSTEITLEAAEESVEESKNIYITLLGENGDLLEGAEFYSEETGLTSTYNTETQQYEMTLPFNGSISVTMPSLTVDGSTFSSGTLSIYDRTDSQTGETSLLLYANGFSSNAQYTIPDTADISLTLVGDTVNANSNLQVVTNFFSFEDYSNTVYYSEAVNIAEEEVSLKYDDIEIVFGNDSADDSIPEGYTDLSVVEKEVPVTVELDQNNVRLTVTPQETLLPNTDYIYTVGAVSAQSDGIAVELYDDDVNFTTALDTESNAFDINDVFVDNSNYYSNGSILVAENTAGVASDRSEFQSQADLYFPTTIESLNYLIMRLTSYTEDNTVYTSSESYSVVVDGETYSSARYLGLQVAYNETVYDNDISYPTYIAYGSTLATGSYAYRLSTDVYSINDNQAGSTNTLTFSYEYQTKDGVTETGTITLPVR